MSFEDLATALQLMRKTRTRTGLRVTVEVVTKYYVTGLPYSAEFRHSMPIVFDDDLSDWNYIAVPGAADAVMLN